MRRRAPGRESSDDGRQTRRPLGRRCRPSAVRNTYRRAYFDRMIIARRTSFSSSRRQ